MQSARLSNKNGAQPPPPSSPPTPSPRPWPPTPLPTLRLQDKSTFAKFTWQAAVFDEAHKLKGIESSTRQVVTELDIRWMLLLTGEACPGF